MSDSYGKTKAPYTNVTTYSHLSPQTPRPAGPACSASGPLPPLSPGPSHKLEPLGDGDPRVVETQEREGPARPGLGSTSPGDEEDDAQRVGGDGEEVESERRPEGDEGATEEHRHRHGTRRSQFRGT